MRRYQLFCQGLLGVTEIRNGWLNKKEYKFLNLGCTNLMTLS